MKSCLCIPSEFYFVFPRLISAIFNLEFCILNFVFFNVYVYQWHNFVEKQFSNKYIGIYVAFNYE